MSLHSKNIRKPKDLGTFSWEDSGEKGTINNPWTREELKEMRKKHPNFYK